MTPAPLTAETLREALLAALRDVPSDYPDVVPRSDAIFAIDEVLTGWAARAGSLVGGEGREPNFGQQMVTKGGPIDRDMEQYIERGSTGPLPAALRAAGSLAPSPEPPDIEATVDSIVERYGGALDALGAPSPEIDVERLAALEAIVWRTSRMGPCSQTHHEHLAVAARAVAARAALATPDTAGDER